jgi:hypothetical protein
MYRLIYSLRVELEPPPGTFYSAIIVNLDRHGCNMLKGGLRPRKPKVRAVDIRAGDDVLVNGQWRRVVGVSMLSERMLTDEEAATHDGAGWLVKAREGYVSPMTGGSARLDRPEFDGS